MRASLTGLRNNNSVRLNLSAVYGNHENAPAKVSLKTASHAIIIRPATAFGRHPGDDLVGVHDVAGLAVDAVGGIQVNLFAVGHVCGFHHFINVGRAEILAGVAELHHATSVADIGVMDDQM